MSTQYVKKKEDKRELVQPNVNIFLKPKSRSLCRANCIFPSCFPLPSFLLLTSQWGAPLSDDITGDAALRQRSCVMAGEGRAVAARVWTALHASKHYAQGGFRQARTRTCLVD
jgi:hypothetical protein